MFLLSILGVRQKWPLKNKIILFSLHKIIRTVKRLKIIQLSVRFTVLFYMINLSWWTNNKHKIPLLGRAEYVLQAWVCTSLLLFTQTVEYWVQLYTKSVCTECTLSVDSSEIWRRRTTAYQPTIPTATKPSCGNENNWWISKNLLLDWNCIKSAVIIFTQK